MLRYSIQYRYFQSTLLPSLQWKNHSPDNITCRDELNSVRRVRMWRGLLHKFRNNCLEASIRETAEQHQGSL